MLRGAQNLQITHTEFAIFWHRILTFLKWRTSFHWDEWR